MHTRRMRHRQAFADNLVGAHVDDNTATVATIAPAVDSVRAADGGHISRFAIVHRQAVQVAAILGNQGADEGWSPNFPKAVPWVDGRQTIIAGVDEDDLTVAINANVMGVHRADIVDGSRDIAGGEHLIGALSGVQAVRKMTDLITRCQIKFIFLMREQAHGALDG